MTIQEILRGEGLTEEQVSSIAESMKKNKLYTTSEENIDIRYGKLKGDNEELSRHYSEAQAQLEELRKSSSGSEALNAKIGEYKAKIDALTKELADEKLASAIKVGLLTEKANDIDYLAYKLREGGELNLGEDGKVQGWSEKIGDLKKRYPNQFDGSVQMKIEPNKLNTGENDKALTRDSVLKMSYAQRADLYQKDPEEFNQIMKK